MLLFTVPPFIGRRPSVLRTSVVNSNQVIQIMMITVTGGSGSGKSAWAESLMLELGASAYSPRYYIATMKAYGEEGFKRVEKHRKARSGKGFITVEHYTGLSEIDLPGGCDVLLECMSNLAANECFLPEGAGFDRCRDEIIKGVLHLKETCRNLVIVTNEIFSSSDRYEKETLRYIQVLGEINQTLSYLSDEVVEVVYGIPVLLKGDALK